MYTVLLVIHIMATLSLIGIILVQRSASDGMGLSGSSSNSFMSGRTAASFVTHTTAILAAVFILTSLALGIVTAHSHVSSGTSIMDKMEGTTTDAAPVAPAATKQEAPAATKEPVKPVKPAVPRPE